MIVEVSLDSSPVDLTISFTSAILADTLERTWIDGAQLQQVSNMPSAEPVSTTTT